MYVSPYRRVRVLFGGKSAGGEVGERWTMGMAHWAICHELTV